MKVRAMAAVAACVSTMVLAQLAPCYADGMPGDEDDNFNPVPSKPGVPAPGVTQPPPLKPTPTHTKAHGATPSQPAPAPATPAVSTPSTPAAPAPQAPIAQPTPSKPDPAPVTAPVVTPPVVTPPAATPPAATPPAATPPATTTPPPAASPATTPGTTPVTTPPASGVVGTQQTVYEILNVDVTLNPKMPNSATVIVKGTTRTSGWKNLELRPLQTFAPEVTMLSFTLVGTPPSGFATQAITPVSASVTMENIPAQVKTIRVLSESNQESHTFR